jgi:regulator of replication initiation timing
MYLRHNFENQLSTLDREIGDLKRNIDKKAVEIQVLLEEKSELRDFLES